MKFWQYICVEVHMLYIINFREYKKSKFNYMKLFWSNKPDNYSNSNSGRDLSTHSQSWINSDMGSFVFILKSFNLTLWQWVKGSSSPFLLIKDSSCVFCIFLGPSNDCNRLQLFLFEFWISGCFSSIGGIFWGDLYEI